MLSVQSDVAPYRCAGKPVSRSVTSHLHRDDRSGLGVLHQRFPAAPMLAHPKVPAGIVASLEAAAATQQAAAGALSPTLDLQDGRLTIDGACFIVRSTPDAESDCQSCVLAPDLGELMAFDTVFPANTHAFTVAAHFDNTIETMKSNQALERQGYQIIPTGRGRLTDSRARVTSAIWRRPGGVRESIHGAGLCWAHESGVSRLCPAGLGRVFQRAFVSRGGSQASVCGAGALG